MPYAYLQHWAFCTSGLVYSADEVLSVVSPVYGYIFGLLSKAITTVSRCGGRGELHVWPCCHALECTPRILGFYNLQVFCSFPPRYSRIMVDRLNSQRNAVVHVSCVHRWRQKLQNQSFIAPTVQSESWWIINRGVTEFIVLYSCVRHVAFRLISSLVISLSLLRTPSFKMRFRRPNPCIRVIIGVVVKKKFHNVADHCDGCGGWPAAPR